ncbi:MAG TPA: glycosyltransferase family 4 protein [Puia sp.]|nr:glycosyltransferase family 4 protein [Puia sp.]
MSGKKKLAIVTTHPIQYHAPWMIRLAEKGIQIKVFYTWEQARSGTLYDPGFGKDIKWDLPLLEGYDYQFVKNTSSRPDNRHFRGIINPDLNKEIEAWGPDSLLIFGWNYHSHLRCMRYFHKKVPVIFRGDSVLLHEKKGLWKLARRLFLNWVYRYVDYALYVGTHNKSYFLKHGLHASQLIFAPHAIDIERFAEPTPDYLRRAESWKKELNIPANHITVLYAGKMIPVKNPGFVIDLAEACKGLPVSFILVGNGSLKPSLQKLAKGNKRIIFLDFQNQTLMPAVYRLGDVYIMPSLSETWGMGINEALACGRPVMASEEVGCAADLILENRTGITFKADDIEKCARFLQELCRDRQRLADMGNDAASLIQFFTFAHIVDSIGHIMGRLNRKTPRPDPESPVAAEAIV